jgi:hypothetical protein
MANVNTIDFSFHLKKGDLYPALKIKLYDGKTSTPFDLTGYTGEFYMSPVSDRSSPVIDGETVTITDEDEGEAEYRWSSGDTDEIGTFYFEFKFAKSGKTFTEPKITPGKVVIEPTIE